MSIPKPKAAAQAAEAPMEEVAQAAEAVKAPSKKIAVEATEKGFYDNSRKNPGDKFFIKEEKHFSKNWMKKI